MFKYLSVLLVTVVGFQASADDFKIFRKAVVELTGKKGYIHCERIEGGVRLIRLGRDKVELNPDGGHYRSRAEPAKLFVESKFKKSLAEDGQEDKSFLDSNFIRNKYLKARDICDDHRALQHEAALIRDREPDEQPAQPGDNDND